MAKNIVTFESYCELRKWKPCGLNADWSVEAYAIRGPGPYGLVALADEAGTYTIVYSTGDSTIGHFHGTFEQFVCFCEHIFGEALHG
jgi:hypothetical protein